VGCAARALRATEIQPLTRAEAEHLVAIAKQHCPRIQTHFAVCEVWMHPDGWELRLIMDGQSLPVATVLQSADEMKALIATWRAALLKTGWT
jgi:hypothetical protein